MTRRTITAALVLVALAAGLAQGWPAIAQGRPVAVETEAVRQQPVVVEASAVGTLLSNESVVVRPEIDGRIVAIEFTEGTPVERGSVLFRLDDALYAAQVNEAQARLTLANQNRDRAVELHGRGAGTQLARDQAKSEYVTAGAVIDLARTRLAKTVIRAPFEGIVGLRQASPGDYVKAGQDLVNLEDIQPIKVEFRIPQRFLGSLRTGQAVRLTTDAFPGEGFDGTVYAVDPQIDPEGRSLRVRARVDNARLRLRPGLFVRVRLELDRRDDALVIPEQAIVPRGDKRFVFKVVDGKAVETPVVLGQRAYGEAEVVEGLSAGDVVVTAGQLKLRNGVPVSLPQPRAPTGPAPAAAQSGS